jgi:hypothetical protein
VAAAALIDFGIIQKLFETLLSTVTGLTVVHMGRPEPTEESSWIRLAGWSFESTSRHRGDDEPDHAEIVFECELVVGPSHGSSWAPATMISRVRGPMEGQTAQDPALPTGWNHRLEILKTSGEVVADPDAERRNRAGAVRFHARAERLSGTTIA